MNNKLQRNKPVVIVAGLVTLFFLVITIWLMLPAGNSAVETIKIYSELTSKSNGTVDKKLMFVAAYVKATGDVTIAQRLGYSQQTIDEVLQPTDPGDQDPSNQDGPHGGVQPSWTAATLQQAVAEYKADHPVTNMKVKQAGGISYPADSQNSYWTGNGGNGGGCHGLGSGCMWFASATAASVVNGRVIGVADLLEARGYTLSTQNGNAYINNPGLSRVGLDGGATYADGKPCTVSGLLSGFCNVSNNKATRTNQSNPWYSQDFIDSGGVYVVHASGDTSHNVSGGGQHWFVIAGKNADGTFIVLNGCGAHGSQGYCTAADAALCGWVLEVTP